MDAQIRTPLTIPTKRILRTTSVLVFLVVALLSTIFNVVWIESRQEFSDFGAFLASAQLAQAGKNPYNEDHPLVKHTFGSTTINLNPPISIFFFLPLAKVDPMSSQFLWFWFSIALILAAFGFLYYQYRFPLWNLLWMIPFAGIWSSLYNGQIYPILLLCLVASLFFFDKQRYLLAGLMTGLIVAIKPNFVLWPVLLLLGGYLTVVIVAGISFLIFSFIPLLYFGGEVYGQWLEAILHHKAFIQYPANGSIQFFANQVGLPWVSVPFTAAILVLLFLLVRRNHLRADKVSALGISGALVLSPLAWPGYTILLLPVMTREWNPCFLTAAIFYLMPIQLVTFFWGSFPIFTFWYWAAMLLLFCGVLLASAQKETISI